MLKCTLPTPPPGSPLRVLCLGAHADDLEIGCGGLMLELAGKGRSLDVNWIVFSANETRRREALNSASVFLDRVAKKQVKIHEFRDGFFPYTGNEIKEYFEALKNEVSPDLILTHYRADLHQDHRVISDLTWNTFRNHFILEYEIPKYDGDLGTPNVFVRLDETTVRRKVDTILSSFHSQEHRQWFSEDMFLSILRLRGMECNSPSGFAEALYARKLMLG